MHGINLLILTAIEIFSIVVIWCSINNIKLSKYLVRICLFAILISISEMITEPLKVSGSYMYLLFLAGALIALKEPFKQTIVFVIITLMIGFAIQALQMLPFLLMGKDLDSIYTFSFALKVDLILAVVSLIIYKWVPLNKIKIKLMEVIDEIIFIAISIALIIVFVKLNWDFRKSYMWSQLALFSFIAVTLVLTQITFVKTVIEKKEQKKIIEVQNQYIPIITELVDDVKRKQHDFSNHLNTIYGIAQVEENALIGDKVKKYIQNLNEDLKDGNTLICMENKELAGILYSKQCQSNEMGISFEYQIKSQLHGSKLKGYQLSIILNNLIDNAFEAVKDNQDKDQRLVVVRTREENEKYYISVENYGPHFRMDHIPKIFSKGYSTKQTSDHGYGLYNVKKIVESVNGQIQLSFEDSIVLVEVIL